MEYNKCRLCLSETGNLIYIFVNGWVQSNTIADVISDVLQVDVIKTDKYPSFVCHGCLCKVTEFKIFKEQCKATLEAYDNEFTQREEETRRMGGPLSVSCGPINLKEELGIFSTDAAKQTNSISADVCEEDPFRDCPLETNSASSDVCEGDPLRENPPQDPLAAVKVELEESINKGESNDDPLFLVEQELIRESGEDIPIEVYRRALRLRIHKGYKWRYSNPKGLFSEESKETNPEELTSHEAPLLDSETRQSPQIKSKPQESQDEESMSKECEAEKHAAEGSYADGRNNEDMQMHSSSEGRNRKMDWSFVRKEHPTEKKPLPCTLCEKRFSRKQHLVNHMRLHTGEKPFLCTLCKKRFTQKTHLVYHMRLHTGEKPFLCALCEKRFTQKTSLVDHMRLHTGEKPFHCALCKKRFTQKTHLVVHMRMHTGEKPFPCTLCEKRYSRKHHLVDHMRIHTEGKLFTCIVCEKHFCVKKLLVEHMRSHTENTL